MTKARPHAVLLLLLAGTFLLPLCAQAQLHAGANPGAPTWRDALREWQEPGFWLFLFVVSLFGALGGIIYELLILKGRLELPHRAGDAGDGEDFPDAVARYLYNLGILSRIIIGSAAAVVVVWLLNLASQGSTAVIAGSIVAGATGIAVFRSLQDRLMAALATRDLVQTQAQAAAQNRKVDEAAAEFEKLRGKIASVAAVPEAMPDGRRGLSFGAPPGQAPADIPELGNISRLLGEARALGFAASAAATSVAERTREIVSRWSGADPSKVTDGRKISEIWDTNPRNPKLNDGFVSVLVRDLTAAFPGVSFVLQALPGVTVADLVVHIETS